jgi:hypothetical protein
MIARDTVCLVLLCTGFSAVACPGADYYVDAISGNDRNTGRGPQVAWQTIHKVNSYREFVPGDRILLRRGQIWREQLVVSVSGTADRPIRIGAYGTGARPTLKGSGPVLNWSQTSQANCWRASLAVMPNQVFFNGTRGVRQGAPVNLDKPLEWAWSDGMLYVYAGSDPGGLYEFPFGDELDESGDFYRHGAALDARFRFALETALGFEHGGFGIEAKGNFEEVLHPVFRLLLRHGLTGNLHFILHWRPPGYGCSSGCRPRFDICAWLRCCTHRISSVDA